MKMTKQEIIDLLQKTNDDCSNVQVWSSDGQTLYKAGMNLRALLQNIAYGLTLRIKPEPEYVMKYNATQELLHAKR
jgi:hypothetical protein